MPPLPTIKSRKRRWKTALAVCGVLAAALAATPFVFTNQIVRYYVDRSMYKQFHLRFKTARLHLLGGVTLEDVALDDVGESAGRPLVHAGHVRLDFQWMQLFSSHFQALDAEDMRLVVRAANGERLTLLRLLPRGAGAGGSASREAVADDRWVRSLSSLPFDRVLLSGTLQVEAEAPWRKMLQLSAAAELPYRIVLTTAGDGAVRARDLALVIGETDSTLTEPVLAARVHLKSPPGGEPQIVIDTLTASNISADLSRGFFPAAGGLGLDRDYALHTDRVQVSGTLTMGAAPFFEGALEVRDFSVHSTDEGAAVAVDRFSMAARVSGPLTARPLRDLTFSKAAVSCDLAQYDVWRLSRAAGSVLIGAREIELADLEGAALDGTVIASGTWDVATESFTRVSIGLQGASVGRMLARVSESLRRPLLFSAEGQFTARLSLAGSDNEPPTGRVDLLCPGRLTVNLLGEAAVSPPTMGLAREDVVVSNLALGGMVSWSGRLADMPELSRGRLSAEEVRALLPVVGGGNKAAVPVEGRTMAASFAVDRGVLRVENLSAMVGRAAEISAAARYDLKAGVLSQGNVSVSRVEGVALSAFLPGDVAIDGQFDLAADFQREASPMLSVTLTGSQQTGIKLPAWVGGTVGIVGKPEFSLRGSPAGKFVFQIDSASLRGLSAIKIDGAAIRYLHDEIVGRGGEDSVAAHLLERFREGVIAAISELTVRGRLDLSAAAPSFTGDAAAAGVDAGTVPEAVKAASLSGLSAKAGITLRPPKAEGPPAIRLSDGELTLDKLALDTGVFTGATATFAAWQGTLTFPTIAFEFDEGSFRGDAAMAGRGRLDRLHLTFSGLNQGLMTANLFPQQFTAEGKTSGTIDLAHAANNELTGSISLTADSAGMLLFTKETAARALAPVTRATAAEIAAGGATLPSNFEELVAGQLANYSYTSGQATFSDAPAGLLISFDYVRSPLKPGDPGYGAQVTIGGRETSANIAINLKDVILSVPDYTVAHAVGKAFGFTDFLLTGPAQAASPTTSRASP